MYQCYNAPEYFREGFIVLCTSYLEFRLVPHAVVILRLQVGHRLRGDVRNICQSSKRNEINCSSNVSCVRGTGSTFRNNEILTMKSTRHRAAHYVIWTVLLGVEGRRGVRNQVRLFSGGRE